MVLSKKSNAKAAIWAFVPLLVTLIVGAIYGAPYASFSGLATMSLLTLIYKEIGGEKFEIFMVYSIFVFLLIAMSIGGWADQGIR